MLILITLVGTRTLGRLGTLMNMVPWWTITVESDTSYEKRIPDMVVKPITG